MTSAQEKEFQQYVQKIKEENMDIDKRLGKEIILNDRQKQLMHYLISGDEAYVTTTSHVSLNKISPKTAYLDLKSLEKQGLLISKRQGKFIRYYAGDKLKILSAH